MTTPDIAEARKLADMLNALNLTGSFYDSAATHLRALADELERLRAQVAEWEAELTAVMPADFKDWHENSRTEWPKIAAGVIRNLRADRDLGWEMAERAQVAPAGWIDINDRAPPLNARCLVLSQEPWEKEPSVKLDRWAEIHEAPLSFSSATVYVGDGWEDDHTGVTHWMLCPPASPAAPAPGEDGGPLPVECSVCGGIVVGVAAPAQQAEPFLTVGERAESLADFLANTLGFVGDVDDAAAEILAFLASQPAAQAEPVGWFESPHGAFRANPAFRPVWPAQSVGWQIPAYLNAPSNPPAQGLKEAKALLFEGDTHHERS